MLGGLDRERLVLNEATLWSGGPYDPNNPEAREALPEVQRLIFEGEYRSAATLAEAKLMGRPKLQTPYQPLGDLLIDFSGHELVTNYWRELDLDTAMATTCYSVAGHSFKREVFVSAADQVLVLRITGDKLTCALSLVSEQPGLFDWQSNAERWYSQAGFGMRGRNRSAHGIDGALRFELVARLRQSGGRVLPGEGLVNVRGADSVIVIAAVATNYLRYDDLTADPRAITEQRLQATEDKSFEELLERHLGDYQQRFRRFTIALGSSSASALAPTDQRLSEYAGGADPGLAALYVQYARYLLLSCSRPGGQPANLQGLWNDKLDPPWGSKCTININTEMNYWPAETAALPECTEPLLELLEDLAETGQRTAHVHYGSRGWVAHHNVDLWRATAPVDGAEWGLWPTGGAWLCLHLWDHYQFTLDDDYLTRVYPILKGASRFFLDTLVVDPVSRHLVTCPSISPENQHPHGSSLCAGPTMDNAIIRDLFSATEQAASILGVDDSFRDELLGARKQLPLCRVGKGGQLQEWLEDWDLDAPEPHHRHISHLFGLYPSFQISPLSTPKLAAAARRALELRGDVGTGWSLAWKLNSWARLHDAERAHELLRLLLSPDRTYTNLFDAHPPFQIDGNFGGAAGILEMLVQSQRGSLHLLPAVPKAWDRGVLRGAKARGGLSVDLEWQDHEVVRSTVVSLVDQEILLRVRGGAAQTVALKAGERAALVDRAATKSQASDLTVKPPAKSRASF